MIPRPQISSSIGGRDRRSAFSLIELLIVIGIMGVLTGLMVPAFQSIMGAGRIPSAATQVASILEFARNEAMTRQTYVWVGFDNFTNVDGDRELRAVAFASSDGLPRASATNLIQLSRLVKMPGVMVTNVSDLKAKTRALLPAGVQTVSVGTNAAYQALSTKPEMPKRVITFTPRGEALLKAEPGFDDGYERAIDVSIRAVRGQNQPITDADDAAVLTSGGSGRTEIIYLR